MKCFLIKFYIEGESFSRYEFIPAMTEAEAEKNVRKRFKTAEIEEILAAGDWDQFLRKV